MSDIRAKWEAEVLTSDLPGSLKIACWAIRKFANKDGECFPSAATLAATYRTSRRQTLRHLNRLQELGWIVRKKGCGMVGRGGRTTLIVLNTPLSSDTLDDTTSNSEVVTDFDEVVTDSPEVVSPQDQSSVTQGDTQTSNHSLDQRTTIAPAGYEIPKETAAWIKDRGFPDGLVQRAIKSFKGKCRTKKLAEELDKDFRNWLENERPFSGDPPTRPSAASQLSALAAKHGIQRQPGESEEVFGRRVRDADTAARYGHGTGIH